VNKVIAGAALLSAITTQALAEFYVVQEATPGLAKRCTVVARRPTTTTVTVVGGSYDTREDATKAMKAMKGCQNR
jgi:hypothetical protein